jgi:hypothetical protein
VHNEISQHNIVEKGMMMVKVSVDPHGVVESTINWTIGNYLYDKLCQEMEDDA